MGCKSLALRTPFLRMQCETNTYNMWLVTSSNLSTLLMWVPTIAFSSLKTLIVPNTLTYRRSLNDAFQHPNLLLIEVLKGWRSFVFPSLVKNHLKTTSIVVYLKHCSHSFFSFVNYSAYDDNLLPVKSGGHLHRLWLLHQSHIGLSFLVAPLIVVAVLICVFTTSEVTGLTTHVLRHEKSIVVVCELNTYF